MVSSGDIWEKSPLKMTSHLVIFRAFFSHPPDPKSEKNVNQVIKKDLAKMHER